VAITKLITDVNNVQALADRPNSNDGLTANELKEVFDKAGADIKDYINNILTPEIDSNSGLNIGIVNVMSYGAKGDGVTNDTASINATFDSLAGGGVVVIPGGTYMIDVVTDSRDRPSTGGIRVPSNVTLFIHPDATLKAITNDSEKYAVLRLLDATNVLIYGGGTIEGERSTHTGVGGEWGNGIMINGGSDITIESINIKDCWGDGIFFGSGTGSLGDPSINVKIKNVVIDNVRRNGISVIYGERLTIDGCEIRNTNGTAPECAIDIEPEFLSVGYTVRGITINNCNFIDNNADGVLAFSEVYNLTISDCLAKGNNRGFVLFGTKGGKLVGNSCKENTLSGIHLEGCTVVSVTANETVLNGENGISVIGSSEKNTITANVSSSNTGSGIYVGGSSKNIISSNITRSNVQQGIHLFQSLNNVVNSNLVSENTQNGIRVFSTSTGNKISGNSVFQNGLNGIANDTCGETSILENDCYENSQTTNSTYHNIYVLESADCSVIGNKCRKGATTNKPARGIFLSGASTNRTILSNNDCYLGGVSFGINVGSGPTNTYNGGNKNIDGAFSTTPS
jgi:parallel beta-helix repeat protein